ncbi:MAG: CHASE2 domain-containing protein [Cyanobacteriota bacterium]
MKKKFLRLKKFFDSSTITAISFLFLLIVFVLALVRLNVLERLELLIYDFKVYTVIQNDNKLIPDNNIVIVNGNDETFKRIEKLHLDFNRWPWPRDVLAEVLEFLSDCEPEAVIFYLNLEVTQGKEKDARLLEAIKKIPRFYGTFNINGYRVLEIKEIEKSIRTGVTHFNIKT